VVSDEDAATGQWQKLDGPDEIVKFYDPTDVFGDLADSLAEAFPDVAEADGLEGDEAEEADDADDSAEHAEADVPDDGESGTDDKSGK
jgi:hypothetical protein